MDKVVKNVVALIMFLIFLVAYAKGSRAAMLLALIINVFVPDEIPFVDEVIELALIFKGND